MNCGTGKTFVEIATIFRARELCNVVVVPALELLWHFAKGSLLDDEPFGPGPESMSPARMATTCDVCAYCPYKRKKLQEDLPKN